MQNHCVLSWWRYAFNEVNNWAFNIVLYFIGTMGSIWQMAFERWFQKTIQKDWNSQQSAKSHLDFGSIEFSDDAIDIFLANFVLFLQLCWTDQERTWKSWSAKVESIWKTLFATFKRTRSWTESQIKQSLWTSQSVHGNFCISYECGYFKIFHIFG